MGERQFAKRIRVYVNERDRLHGRPLAHSIVSAAKTHGLAGATVFRGLLGFGVHSRVHVVHALPVSDDLPVVVEIIDRPDRIEAFLPVLDPLVPEGLITVDDVDVVFYRHRPGRRSPEVRREGLGG